MNILQVVSSSRTSGAEKHVVLLSKWLQLLGHNVTAVCPPGGWLPGQLREAGISTVEVPMRGPRSTAAIFTLRKLVEDWRIDIVNTHLTRATYLGYFAGLLAKVPVISTVQIKTRDVSYRYLSRQRLWLVAVSNHIRQDLIARGARADRIQTVYNCTEFIGGERPEPAPIGDVRSELGLPHDSLLVGLLGRVDSFKGAYILADAAQTIVNRCPLTHVVFIGNAEPDTREDLLRIAGEAAGRLHFIGVRNDVPRLLEAIDVVTLPSISEACSLAIIEAMAMGKPVVATRAGGNLELINHGRSGLLVDRRPEPLADAICELLNDPERRAAMGRAANERANEMFTAEVMAKNMESLYIRVLDQRRSKGNPTNPTRTPIGV
jgi:glycosyltransferase involved in cell wall biosynthesis